MFSIRTIVLIAAAFAMGAESSTVPALAAAPLVAPAHVGYAHAVPQNIPPYAAQVNAFSKALSPLFAAPAALAAPLAAPVAAPLAAPLGAPVAGPYAASYLAGPAPYALPAAAAYAAPVPYAAPFPYAAPYPYSAAPLVRAPYGVAPAFVR